MLPTIKCVSLLTYKFKLMLKKIHLKLKPPICPLKSAWYRKVLDSVFGRSQMLLGRCQAVWGMHQIMWFWEGV